MSNWRERLAPIIARVIEDVGTKDEKTLRRALRRAFPAGERKYHPYKIWLSEIKRQLKTPLKVIPKVDSKCPVDHVEYPMIAGDWHEENGHQETADRLREWASEECPLFQE